MAAAFQYVSFLHKAAIILGENLIRRMNSMLILTPFPNCSRLLLLDLVHSMDHVDIWSGPDLLICFCNISSTQRLQGKMQLDSTHSFEFSSKCFRRTSSSETKRSMHNVMFVGNYVAESEKLRPKMTNMLQHKHIRNISYHSGWTDSSTGRCVRFQDISTRKLCTFPRSSLSQICEAVCWL